MRTIKQTNDMQKQLMSEMNVDTIDDMVDEMREMKFMHEEFQEAMNRNYEIDVDDSELDDELEQLDYEMKIDLDAKQLCVPNKRIVSQKEQDERELEDLVHKS
jgi:hypothetical protein